MGDVLKTVLSVIETVTGKPYTQKDMKADERRIRDEIVTWLCRKFGREGIREYENAAGRAEVIAALNNSKISDFALLCAMKQEDCARMTDYFGCQCEGNPIERCPHSHAYYAVQAIYSSTGAITGFSIGACLCAKYRAEADRLIEQKKREEEAKKKGWWGKDSIDYEDRRKKLVGGE